MRIGTAVRNMGPAATTRCMRHCAQYAEAQGLEHIWVVDHIAIPPDDAAGSNGRWIDPLAALAFFAAATTRVQLGVSVLVLPYRPALPTAKWIASIQELSGERFLLGVGPGWMAPEYKALGVDKSRRGQITDEIIDFIRSCFETPDDVVEANAQKFLFRPRPKRPPIYVGGMTDKALERTIRCGDGWLPMGMDPQKLAPKAAKLQQMATATGRDCPPIITIASLPPTNAEAVDKLSACAALGVTDFIQASRYESEGEFEQMVGRLVEISQQL